MEIISTCLEMYSGISTSHSEAQTILSFNLNFVVLVSAELSASAECHQGNIRFT